MQNKTKTPPYLYRPGDLLPFLLCSAVELPFPGFKTTWDGRMAFAAAMANRGTWWVKASLQRSLLTSPEISLSTDEWKFSSVKISLTKSKPWAHAVVGLAHWLV